MASRILPPLLRLILPQDCVLCGAAVPTAEDQAICPSCEASLPLLPRACCPVCALPMSGGDLCGACLDRPPRFDATLALFSYEFPVDRLVQALKYQHRLVLAGWLGKRLAEELEGREIHPDLVLPMPLSAWRLAERGFNQALELARPLVRHAGLELDPLAVERCLDAPPQASLPWKARRQNVRGAFLCRRDLAGLEVLVIDDVMTTGASLDELAQCLKTRGARRVTNLVVARTLPSC